MKAKAWVLLMAVLACTVLSGCVSSSKAESSGDLPAPASSGASEYPASFADDGNGIDVDLTALSSTMVYAEVFNILSEPEKHIGKTVRMRGQFAVYHDEATGTYYFACLIADATACCLQGFEFVLDEACVYPDNYPAEGAEITVTGVVETYEENGMVYCRLADAGAE